MSQIKICGTNFGARCTTFGSIIWQSINKQYLQQFRQQTIATNVQTKNPQDDWDKARPFEELPGPTLLQMIRDNIPGGKYYNMSMDKTFNAIQKEYGDIMLAPGFLGKAPIVLSSNPSDYEIIFRNEGVWPHRIGAETMSYYRTKVRADFFKGVEGLVTSQGEAWGDFRSKVNPVMLQPKNVRLYLQKMSDVNKEFIEIIRKIRDPKTKELPGNFESYINRWTLESVCIVALDKQLGLFKEDQVEVQKLFDCITDFMTLCNQLDNKPSPWKYIATPGYKRLMRAYDGILEVTSHYINQTMQELEEEKRKGIEKTENQKSVLEKLLKIDQKVAIVMAMDMLMAGVDTTSSSFTAIMLCLAKNPLKQAKLREELRRILPQKNSEFTEKSLNDMSYLRCCIKEAMRLYPLVIGNARMVQRDVVLSGYRIPKGTIVGMMNAGLYQNEKYFSQANEFIPERWLRTPKENDSKVGCPSNLKTSNPFVYLPFGFGPRSCIGRRIAEMELEVGVARIVRNFNVAFNYSTENAFKSLLVNVPNIPLRFEVTDVET